MKDYHHLDASNMRFSIFSSKNLRELSVAKVVTPLVFDQLGHPLPGGLYDQKMGEYDKCLLPSSAKCDDYLVLFFQAPTLSVRILAPRVI